MNLLQSACTWAFTVACIVTFRHAEACGTPTINPKNFARIAGGTEAASGSWPWMAQLGHRHVRVFEATSFNCGATVISSKWIITAARCLRDPVNNSAGLITGYVVDAKPENYIIRVGFNQITPYLSPQPDYYEITRVIVHEQYVPEGWDHDIALMEVKGTIAFNERVSPACLPVGNTDPREGLNCVATGWGSVFLENPDSKSGVLQEVDLKIVSRETCAAVPDYAGKITEDMICAGDDSGKGSCPGDRGGPLVCENEQDAFVLEGIISWGNGCIKIGAPGVYTRTSYYSSWLAQHTGELSQPNTALNLHRNLLLVTILSTSISFTIK